MSLNLTIVGTGYVGLVSGVCFAQLGHRVTCVDSNMFKIQQLQSGDIPIYEPGLEALLRDNVVAGRLRFSSHLEEEIQGRDAIFIAVGTPTAPDGISADLSAVHAVARALAPHLKSYTLVITKSTVPVLTNKAIEQIILDINPKAQFDICSNPEFLREGSAIDDFMNPDRIIVGLRNDKARKMIERLYTPLTSRGCPLLVTTPESAELIKYASNALLATKIAFINEIADLAEVTQGEICDIAKGVGMDSRIGEKFLRAGPGYGGSCFPKDTRALAHMSQAYRASSQIIEAVIQSNDDRKQSMAGRIIQAMGGDLEGKKIAILGVTFKANTDDMRDSVALDIIPQLLAADAEVHVYDPAANQHAFDMLPQSVYWHDTAMAAIAQADALVLLTDWAEFGALDLRKMRQAMQGDVLVDLRNFYAPEDAIQAGFIYHSIGRSIRKPDGAAPIRVIK